MAALEPELSESPVVAQIPADVVVLAPAAGVPMEQRRWSGVWAGWGGQGRSCDLKIAVQRIHNGKADLSFAIASGAAGPLFHTAEASFHGAELRAWLPDRSRLNLRWRGDGAIDFLWNREDGAWTAGVLGRGRPASRLTQWIPTDQAEDGKSVRLEAVIFKPAGVGPFPCLMFNHGSTGEGNDPSLFTSTWTCPALARFFTERGWLVAFPQRRGRGKSGGTYDEGMEPDRSRYSDDPCYALPGVDRALADLHSAAGWLARHPDVDPSRMVIGGESRGGILSVACPDRAALFRGCINFVGGWVDDRGPAADEINQQVFCRGGAPWGPTLWLYAQDDPFYSIAHSRRNFEAYCRAGGRGDFHVVQTPEGFDGHHIAAMPRLWSGLVEDYLSRIFEACL